MSSIWKIDDPKEKARLRRELKLKEKKRRWASNQKGKPKSQDYEEKQAIKHKRLGDDEWD